VFSCAIAATAPTGSWTETSWTRPAVDTGLVSNASTAGSVSAIRDATQTRTSADAISELRAISGLTIDQVGRLLGVSRRSVHNWLNGSVMAAVHAERLSSLINVISAIPASSAIERRAVLFDSSRGVSLFHQLLAQQPEQAQLQFEGVSVRDRISL
jgi:DNA-binding transcriptional regulator YiaG